MTAFDNYVLDGHIPVPEPNIDKWYTWWSTHGSERRVDWTPVPGGNISTVFLGSDHNFGADGEQPILFETMAFVFGADDNECVRTCTWDEAQAAHNAMVARYCSADVDAAVSIGELGTARTELICTEQTWNPQLASAGHYPRLNLLKETDIGTSIR